MDDFKAFLTDDKKYAPDTVRQYLRYTTAYVNEFGDPAEQPQEEVVKNIKTFNPLRIKVAKGEPASETISGQGQTIRAVVAYLKFKGKPHEQVSNMFVAINRGEVANAKARNEKIAETLMPYEEYNSKVNELYTSNEPEKQRQYVINKLLVYSSCRNADLNCVIITTKQEHEDMIPDVNYLYIDQNNDIQFIRNVYKTKKTYGSKVTKIKSKKLSVAIRVVRALTEDDGHHLIPARHRGTSLARYIKAMTFGIGETNLLKLMLAHNNSLAKAKKISVNRGTSLETLQQNYNIKD
jgi:hypothetical protein